VCATGFPTRTKCTISKVHRDPTISRNETLGDMRIKDYMWVKGVNHQFVVWMVLSNNPTTINMPEGSDLFMLEFQLKKQKWNLTMRFPAVGVYATCTVLFCKPDRMCLPSVENATELTHDV
jgi:hypothetical protein